MKGVGSLVDNQPHRGAPKLSKIAEEFGRIGEKKALKPARLRSALTTQKSRKYL